VRIQIREDSRAKRYLARGVGLAILRSWRVHAIFTLLGASFAIIWAVIGSMRGLPTPTRPDIFLLSGATALLGVVSSGLAYALYRLLPAQRWTLDLDRICMRGRDLGSVKYKKLHAFAIEPIPDLPGYTFIAVYRANGRSHSLVAVPSSPIPAVDAELARRLTRRCS
jgi:hypothetical protein